MIEGFITEFGYIGSFLLVLLEYANFPLPSEVVLPMIGVIIAKYDFSLISMILITSIGGLIGSLINYFLGYKYGVALLNKVTDKFSSLRKPMKSAQHCIVKYDRSALLVSRMIPLARTAISLVAGVSRMSLGVFIAYSFVGITIWNSILIYLGFLFNNNLALIANILSKYSILCLVLILIGIIIFIKARKIKKR